MSRKCAEQAAQRGDRIRFPPGEESMNRRDLFKSAALAGAFAQGARAASDRIGIGVIGCGGMGRMDLADFQKQPEAEIVAVSDVYQPNLQEAHQLTGGEAR